MTRSSFRLSSSVALLVLAIAGSACGPQGSLPVNAPGEQQPAARPKILVLGQTTEPTDLAEFAIQATRGNTTVINIGHQGLAAVTECEARIPVLAVDVPKIQDGTWRINADGTMETTWK